jgi:hypothetical protein
MHDASPLVDPTSRVILTLGAERVISRRGEQVVPLRHKAFEMLRHLVENAVRLIVKDESSASRRWCTRPTEPAALTFSDEWDRGENDLQPRK